MATARDLSPEALAVYKAAARRRAEQEARALTAREERAWELARQVANLLRQQFGVSRVAVFGSLVHPGYFTPWSDVDLAVWGLRPEDTFRAIGVAMDADRDIEVNLVDAGAYSGSLIQTIEREGVDI
jgi:predicted nucleotidyltransferase